MEDLPHSKPELRRQIRSNRRAMSPVARINAARNIADQVETAPGWHSATHIALYMAADGEVDPAEIATRLRRVGKIPYLPVIKDDQSLRFAAWAEDDQLVQNRYGIPEPTGEQLPAAAMDIVLVPLVAWDPAGNRLGMGGGFYDRTLAAGDPVLKLGLAYEFQRVAALPAEPWDVRLDFIATECALYECQGID